MSEYAPLIDIFMDTIFFITTAVMLVSVPLSCRHVSETVEYPEYNKIDYVSFAFNATMAMWLVAVWAGGLLSISRIHPVLLSVPALLLSAWGLSQTGVFLRPDYKAFFKGIRIVLWGSLAYNVGWFFVQLIAGWPYSIRLFGFVLVASIIYAYLVRDQADGTHSSQSSALSERDNAADG